MDFKLHKMRLNEVLMVMSMNIISWHVTPCSLAGQYQLKGKVKFTQEQAMKA